MTNFNSEKPTNHSRWSRILEVIALWVMVQLPPALLGMAKHASYANFSGYLLTLSYWAAFGLAICIAYRRFRYWSGQRLFHDFKWRDLGIAILAYLVIVLGESLLLRLQQVLYHQQSTANNDAISQIMKTSPVALVAFVFSAIFLTPFLEELVFRGVITNIFFKPSQTWLKIILSGLIFSTGHLSSNPISFLVYCLMGAVLAATYLWTGKQFNSILVHFLINSLAMTQLLVTILH